MTNKENNKEFPFFSIVVLIIILCLGLKTCEIGSSSFNDCINQCEYVECNNLFLNTNYTKRDCENKNYYINISNVCLNKCIGLKG